MINQALILQHVEEIRRDAALFMMDTAQIKRKVGVIAVKGQAVTQYSDPIETKCRVINRTGATETPIASQFRAAQISTATTLTRMQIPLDAEIAVGDIIIYNEAEYDVIYVPEKHALLGSLVISLQIKT